MSGSDHSALGQALGYVYQFDRATYRLLEADQNVVTVAIEHFDDVSVHQADGSAVFEQDKVVTSSLRALSDRSVALWKTLALWAEQVLKEPGILGFTEFHLVTNGEVAADGLAGRIHVASSDTDAAAVADELLSVSASLRDELKQFGVALAALGKDRLSGLIANISVLDRVALGYGGDLERLPALRYFSPIQRAAIFNNASAWVRKQASEAAKAGTPVSISRPAFDQEVRALLRHTSVAPLAVIFETPSTELDPARYASYGFFQQLDWVDTDPGLVRDCVIHYAQARYTRAKWAETDAVSEQALQGYEDELQFRWKLLATRQTEQTFPSPAVQGRQLLTDTLALDTALQGQQLPKAFTCGSFHALADFDSEREPAIGWHPSFREKVKGTSQ